jgi:hypothetical protein
MTKDFLEQLNETIKRDPILSQLEKQIENRKKEIEKKYPVRKVGLSTY